MERERGVERYGGVEREKVLGEKRRDEGKTKLQIAGGQLSWKSKAYQEVQVPG